MHFFPAGHAGAPRGGRHGRLLAALAAWALLAQPFAAEPASAPRYTLGRGLKLPSLDLTLSGYASLRAHDLEGAGARFDVRDLSVFTTWNPSPRWQVFAEIEVEDLLTIDRGVDNSDTEVVVERLYVDFIAAPEWSVRAGRYLTPFSRWNLVHADPLVWTVTRPLVTTLAMPDHGTGLLFHGTTALASDTLEYTVYLDDSEDLDPVHGEADFEDFVLPGLSNDLDRAVGAQLRLHGLGKRAEIAASYARMQVKGLGDHQDLFGVDAVARWRGAELSSELAYRFNGARFRRDDWGGFVQAVVPLVDELYATTRFEFYSSGVLREDAARVTAGLAWRPLPAIKLKLEYHDGNSHRIMPDGWETSLGILF